MMYPYIKVNNKVYKYLVERGLSPRFENEDGSVYLWKHDLASLVGNNEETIRRIGGVGMSQMLSNPSVAVEHFKNRLSTKPRYEVCNLGETHIVSTYDEAAHSVKTQRAKLTSAAAASSISDTAITIDDNALYEIVFKAEVFV